MAAQTPRLRVPLAEVDDAESDRIDARKIADPMAVPLPHVAAAVGASYAAVHKTPDAQAIQSSAWGDLRKELKGDYDDSVWDHPRSAPFEAGEHRQ